MGYSKKGEYYPNQVYMTCFSHPSQSGLIRTEFPTKIIDSTSTPDKHVHSHVKENRYTYYVHNEKGLIASRTASVEHKKQKLIAIIAHSNVIDWNTTFTSYPKRNTCLHLAHTPKCNC